MSSLGFFEVHITTHQHGSSETNYGAVHKQMAAHGFERVIQTTAQQANEVPGVYRLHNAQLTMAQAVEVIRLSLTPLGRGMAVRLMKVDEETLFNLIPSAAVTPADAHPGSDQSPSAGSEAQSGYPAWRRPR